MVPEAAADEDVTYDFFVTGPVFLDIIFTGLQEAPVGGREVMTSGMGSSPGGVATLAVAASRLGLKTSLAAAFGDDMYGDYLWATLEDDESIDLSRSHRWEHWHSPVTVSLAYDMDRAMITHAHKAPRAEITAPDITPAARAAFADVADERPAWVDTAAERGTLVFADVGWDPTGRWDSTQLRERLDGCYAFVPNALEAMTYTGTDSPGAALERIRDWVPLAVVTAGSSGSYAADAQTGETAWVPALNVPALDPTGAGDVFLAGLVAATLREWPLIQRLRFANLCAALSVRDFGGALAAPGWGAICEWWEGVEPDTWLSRDYAFLEDVLATVEHRTYGRAVATIGFVGDTHDHPSHNPPPPPTRDFRIAPRGE
ncbi:carbohydrate kinase family protein [Mumia quercus]|uniref:carbohydrate kinase family protein n=1 Tax=Mumia quercus TaxID=2976125 RepID=UPI0021CEA30B|nr:PfkB family carbohydrate kinase [Mumia quercus]